MKPSELPEAAPAPTQARAMARARRREELLDAAVELVRRDGPHVSMGQIAAECGITKPIIYRHFGDRDGLLMEIAVRFADQLAVELMPLTSREGSAREVLMATMDAYLGLIERDTNLYRFLSDHAGSDKRDLVTRLIAEQVSIVLEQRLVAADLDPAGGRPWAYGLVGMVHFAGDWWSEDKRTPRSELVERLMTLAWDGLGSLDIDARSSAVAVGAARSGATRSPTNMPTTPSNPKSPASRRRDRRPQENP